MVIRATLKIEAPVYGNLAGHLRLTIPVREALEAHHNIVTRITTSSDSSDDWYSVRLSGIVPKGIVECLIDDNQQQYRGLRLIHEPKYPGEWAEEEAIAWWERGAWVPCPVRRCGRALVWYEAGYVPGYRVCTRGHHVQLSQDGRSAKPVQS